MDFAWILADSSACRLLKVAASDEVQPIPLDHLTPPPRIQALCTDASTLDQRVYVLDDLSGNVLEVDTSTGCVLRSLGACLKGGRWLFATPTLGHIAVADARSACVRLLPTRVQIRVTSQGDDVGNDDESSAPSSPPPLEADTSSNTNGDIEIESEMDDITWMPVRYQSRPWCMLRPVGVACSHDTMAVLLSAVGNIEISEVRFYRM